MNRDRRSLAAQQVDAAICVAGRREPFHHLRTDCGICEFTDFLRRRDVPVLGEAPVDTHTDQRVWSSLRTPRYSDRPGEASIALEKQIDEQTALSGRGGAPGMSLSGRR